MIPLCKTPKSELLLEKNDIHVWRADLALPIMGFQEVNHTLSNGERMRAERFHFEKDRKRFIIGRGILRTILGCYLSVEPSQVQFCYGKHGKPALADTFGNERIHFNLSHSEGLALYAFTQDHEIGVDIERIRDIPEMDQIVERFFSVNENALFQTLHEVRKKEAFIKCWVRKEAFIKAKGEGLGFGLDKYEVSFVPGEPAALLSLNDDAQEASHWALMQLDPEPGYAAALAVNGHELKVRYV